MSWNQDEEFYPGPADQDIKLYVISRDADYTFTKLGGRGGSLLQVTATSLPSGIRINDWVRVENDTNEVVFEGYFNEMEEVRSFFGSEVKTTLNFSTRRVDTWGQRLP